MLVLVRGVSGSGKSTFAQELVESNPDICHYEADMWMVDQEGNYLFNPKMLSVVHGECQRHTKKSLEEGKIVVVSNTFTQVWEMKPYIEMAEELGVVVIINRMTGSYKNVHGVPDHVVKVMEDRFEDYEGENIIPPST